jgi:hypothetical protein
VNYDGEGEYKVDLWKLLGVPYKAMALPENWPENLEAAIHYLNNRILPYLKYSPNEFLLGLVINTKPTPSTDMLAPLPDDEIEMQMAYVDQHRFDGYSHIVEHGERCKATSDKQVLAAPLRR